MYNCGLCGKTTNLNEKANFVVLKKRKKIYPQRAYANRQRDEEGKWKYIPDNGGEGFETVLEVKCCQTCANQRKGSHATVVQ